MPDTNLPNLQRYPGGTARVEWHLQKGLESFEHYFGFAPTGCWPSEGSVSTEALKYFQAAGFRWVASGQNVLHNSLLASGQPLSKQDHPWLYHPYQVDGGDIACFFRDDGLSDLIGFTYSEWHADDAVANLIGHLETIAATCKSSSDAVVSIILDGENAWEHYPENGFYFLEALYKGLAEHARLELTTFSECLDDGVAKASLPALVAGSWVYGTFSTWIGDSDKNRAWDMLGEAKQCYDRIMASGVLSQEQQLMAQRQLAICEGSDWFWWFGDYNPEDTVSDFERLYRQQLTTLYQMLGQEPPEYLVHVFTKGGGAPHHGGAMRRGSE
jgi:alpha-amylase/alpha-mannosidase (GH57 family)